MKGSSKVLLGNELLIWMALHYTNNKYWQEMCGLSIELIKTLHLDIFSDSKLLPCDCILYYLFCVRAFIK